jgi:aryl-alcohol dehydrogenase-like predicted oxidoreductase
MKKLRLKNTNINVTPLIMGCWQAGKAYWQNIDDNDSIAAMRAAYDAGITTFDTAPGYGDGHSERILAKALGSERHNIVIATKVFSDHLTYSEVLKECDKSLKNLNTDYIDLYQIHWPSGSWGHDPVPISETMRALNELKQAGKIRAIGVSNFSLPQLQEALQYGEIVSNQPPYSLFVRHIEQDLLPFCDKNGILTLAYSPLAQGLLSGRYTRTHQFPKDEFRAQNKLCEPHVYEVVQEALDMLRPIAAQYHTSLTQLALAWVMAQPKTCAIAGARTATQVSENAKSMQLRLSADTVKVMSEIGDSVYQLLDNTAMPWQL